MFTVYSSGEATYFAVTTCWKPNWWM